MTLLYWATMQNYEPTNAKIGNNKKLWDYFKGDKMDFEDFDESYEDFSEDFDDSNESLNINASEQDEDVESDKTPLDDWEDMAMIGGLSEEISKEKKEKKRIIKEFEENNDRFSDQ